MDTFVYDCIPGIIEERTREWALPDSEKELIRNNLVEVLDYCAGEDIFFDELAGPVFLSHLITLYKRVKEDDFVDMETDFADELSPEILAFGKHVAEILKRQYGRAIPENETVLIATHLGAMQVRLNEEKGGV